MRTKVLNKYSAFMSTLKDTSFDDDNQTHMTQSMQQTIHFDDFKEHYASTRNLTKDNTPRSCDALFICKHGKLHFIEFRNASSKRNFKQQKVKEKVYDSLLMLADTIDETISALAKCTDLIIVYNGSMYNNPPAASSQNLPHSESFRALGNSISSHGNLRVKEFKLASFEGFCFRRVYTFTQSEFDQHLATL